MAQLDGVIKTGNYNAILQENAVEYYYNAYTSLSSALYRAKVSGEFVYYTGASPVGATDIVIVKRGA